MNAADRLPIARILKVNHAGEYGAIRIYRAQAWIARRIYPDLVPFLEETLRHEVLHCSGERRRVDRPRHDPPVRVSAGVRMAELSFDVAIEIEMTARVRD